MMIAEKREGRGKQPRSAFYLLSQAKDHQQLDYSEFSRAITTVIVGKAPIKIAHWAAQIFRFFLMISYALRSPPLPPYLISSEQQGHKLIDITQNRFAG